MNFSAWSINRPLPAILLFILLTLVGLFGFQQLAVSRFPDVSYPGITVTVALPGATPSQLETEVTRKVEDSVATVNNVKRVMSSVSEGVSTTTIEFQLEADLATALDDTRDAVTRIRTDLPQDIQEPVISKVDIGGSLMTYALVAPHMTTDEASWFVDRDISRAMYGVPGVARVTRVGGVQRQVRVDLDPNALIAMTSDGQGEQVRQEGEQEQQQRGTQHDRHLLPDQLDVDHQRRDDGRQAQDEQHVEDVAAHHVADGDVGLAVQHRTHRHRQLGRAGAEGHDGQAHHQR